MPIRTADHAQELWRRAEMPDGDGLLSALLRAGCHTQPWASVGVPASMDPSRGGLRSADFAHETLLLATSHMEA